MLKQSRPEQSKSKRNLSYSLSRRTAAFFRGLNRFSPLLEVAREGLSNGYRLPRKTECVYARRIGRVNNKKDAFDSLALGISPAAQEIVTAELRKYFERITKTLRYAKINFTIRSNPHIAQHDIKAHALDLINGMRGDVSEIRERSDELLKSGKMTSEKAVENLKAILEVPHWNF